jgi:hypothetical protein
VTGGTRNHAWGRAGAAHHRKTMDNSGVLRSADRAGQQPFPSVRPGHAITRIVSRTEEARGSNPLTSTPKNMQVRAPLALSGRRSRHVPAVLRPQAQVTVQPGGLSETRGDSVLGRTMTTQRGHRQLLTDGRSSPASRLSRSATRSTWPTANHRPRRPSRSRPASGPARPVPASRAASTSGRRRAVVDTAGRPRRPRPSQPCGCRPHRHAPRPHSRRTQRTPDTGHLAQTPAPDTGHLDRPRRTPDARTGHRTSDIGRRTPDGNADTVTTAQPASGPPWPRRATAC